MLEEQLFVGYKSECVGMSSESIDVGSCKKC